MKNIYEVLRQKEAEYQKLEKEIEALRVVARLLADEHEPQAETVPRPAAGVDRFAAPRSGSNSDNGLPTRQFP